MKRKMRILVETRITVACEILYPRHEDVFAPNPDASVRDLYDFAHHYVRDALHNGAHRASVEMWYVDEYGWPTGDEFAFRIDGIDQYWIAGDRITMTH